MMAMHQQQQMHQSPFAMMNQMMGQMGGFGGNNFNMMSQMSNGEPSQAMYSSSSVMTYSNSGDGKPKIYQASSQVRQVAGGHHIGDRAHVIERQKYNGGDVEEMVNLENLDDSDIPEFSQEFENKLASQVRSSHNHHHHRPHHLGNHQPFAIEDKDKKKDKKSKSKSKH